MGHCVHDVGKQVGPVLGVRFCLFVSALSLIWTGVLRRIAASCQGRTTLARRTPYSEDDVGEGKGPGASSFWEDPPLAQQKYCSVLGSGYVEKFGGTFVVAGDASADTEGIATGDEKLGDLGFTPLKWVRARLGHEKPGSARRRRWRRFVRRR